MFCEAHSASFNSFEAGTIAQSLIVLMLLFNADLQNIQRISIVAAIVSNSKDNEDGFRLTDAQLMSKFKYEVIAAVLRHNG